MNRHRALIIGLLIATAIAAAPADAIHPPARIQVTASEYKYVLSRQSIKAGTAIIELVNFGEDPHNLHLRRLGSTTTHRLPTTQPGDYHDRTIHLRPGIYQLWCSIANHRKLGMQAQLTVKP